MFKPGQSGNPKGKPKGATSKYTAASVVRALENEFKDEPGGFLGFITKRSRDSERFLIALLDKVIANAEIDKGEGNSNIINVVFTRGSAEHGRDNLQPPAETRVIPRQPSEV